MKVNMFPAVILSIAATTAIFVASCNKDNEPDISEGVTDGATVMTHAAAADTLLPATVKGTMKSGRTFYIDREVTVNEGDTLLLEEGVKVYALNAAAAFIIKGSFVSLGTEENPNVLGLKGKSRRGKSKDADHAMDGWWGGLIGAGTCPMMIVKWTSIEYTGSHFVNAPITGLSGHNYYWGVTFQNPAGILVIEDSWIFGVNTEGVRITGGKVSIMRNTIERMGKDIGDALALKTGTTGDVAYNLLIGCSSHGIVVDNYQSTVGQHYINTYNNTIVNSGWRTARNNEIYAIRYHRDAAGDVFNNAVVNCRGGLFFPAEQPANMELLKYGNNYFYGDTKEIAEGFYPAGAKAAPQPTDIPALSAYSEINPADGVYDGTPLAAKNAPLFKTFAVPEADPKAAAAADGENFDFHPQAGSPLIGRGKTDFAARSAVPVDPKFGATEITKPGKDMGAFQTDGTGNRH